MTYQQLISQLSEDTKYTKRELRTILRHIARILAETLSSGHTVKWDSVGAFYNMPDHVYCVRNYKTGERYWTKPRRKIKFKPSIRLRNKVRQSIALFQEPTVTEQYLPKEHHGEVRSGDRPGKGGTGKDSGKESTGQSQRQHTLGPDQG